MTMKNKDVEFYLLHNSPGLYPVSASIIIYFVLFSITQVKMFLITSKAKTSTSTLDFL